MSWEHCDSLAKINLDGIKSEEEAIDTISNLTLQVGATGTGEYGPTENGWGIQATFECNGSTNCLRERLKKLGILGKVKFTGNCVNEPKKP